MKRPKFFEDLDRSLAGEELEPEIVEPEIMPAGNIPVTVPKGSSLMELVQQMQMSGAEQMTATGAMIAAAQQDQAMRALYYEQIRRAMQPGIHYDPYLTPGQSTRGYAFGSIWNVLGLK